MKTLFYAVFSFILIATFICDAAAQTTIIYGNITAQGKPLGYANVGLKGTTFGAITDSAGKFAIKNTSPGTYKIHISCLAYDCICNDGVWTNCRFPG